MFDLAAFPLAFRVVDKTLFLWDPIRRKTLRYRPEERVRQQFISFLLFALHIPRSLIGVEVPIRFPQRKIPFRADIIVSEAGSLDPDIIVEVKSPGIKINHKTITQIQRYEKKSNIKHWVIVNGESWQVFTRKNGKFIPADGLPRYKDSLKEKIFPAYSMRVWEQIINEDGFRKNEKDWRKERYALGLVGEDEPQIGFTGLQINRILKDKDHLCKILTQVILEFIITGSTFLEFSDKKGMSFWHNNYTLIELKSKKLAIGLGLNSSGQMCLRAIVKKSENQFKYKETEIEKIAVGQSKMLPENVAGMSQDILLTFLKSLDL